jgi:hypothetical protein
MNGQMGAIEKIRHIASTKAMLAEKRSKFDQGKCTSPVIKNLKTLKYWCQAAFARKREAKRYKIQAAAHSYNLINSMEVLTKKID